MTGTTFASYIRERTKTNSTTFTDARIVVLANVVKDDLAAKIITNVDEGYFDMEMKADLEADIRDYSFENGIVKNLKYAHALLDGTNPEYLTEADYSLFETQKRPSDETTIRDLYAARKPQYLITGISLKILSGAAIAAVTEGLKVVGEVFPEDIASGDLASASDLSIPSSTIEHRLPQAAHRVWAKMVVIEYKQSREKPIPLTEDEKKVELDLEELYKTLRKRNAVRSFVAAVPRDDGQEY